MNKLIFIIAFSLILIGDAFAIPIIPGLQGYGVETTAGSGPDRIGGKIIHVTNLNPSGPGSLREGIETVGPRTIVFNVSGTVDITNPLQSLGRLDIHEPYLTIAGQTAPSPGITIKGDGMIVATHDVLIQHIRIRVGDDPNGSDPSERDGLSVNAQDGFASGDVYNVVLDHVSVSWGIDENVSVTATRDGINKAHDVTISNSIISESLLNSIHPKGPHGMGVLLGSGASKVFMYKNLLAHNDRRSIRFSRDSGGAVVNNLIYNTGTGVGEFGGAIGLPIFADVVGNEYIRGLSTTLGSGKRPMKLRKDTHVDSEIYIADNLSEETPNPVTDDPWLNVKLEGGAPTFDDVRVFSPVNFPTGFIPQESSTTKVDIIINVGARPSDRDTVDKRVINDVAHGTGMIIDSQEDVGGWPVLAENYRIPDVPHNPWHILPSGYNRVEEWLHAQASLIEN